jgi:hypothetical protein
MANEAAGGFHPSSLCPQSPGYGLEGFGSPYGYVPVGEGKGTGLWKNAASGVIAWFRVPETVTLGTGLTVSILLADDVQYPGAGLKPYIGVTVGPIVSGTTTLDEGAAGPFAGSTEVAAQVTMPATSGVLVVASFALPNADLNSLAAGSWAAIRVRRLGTNASDTHPGRVVLLGAQVRNT